MRSRQLLSGKPQRIDIECTEELQEILSVKLLYSERIVQNNDIVSFTERLFGLNEI